MVLSLVLGADVPSVVPPLGSTRVTAKVVTESGSPAVPRSVEAQAEMLDAARSAEAVISLRAGTMAAERSGAVDSCPASSGRQDSAAWISQGPRGWRVTRSRQCRRRGGAC